MDDDTKYLAALSHFPKFGPQRLNRLFDYFQSYRRAWQAGARELAAAGLKEKLANEFVSRRGEIDPDQLAKRLAHENIHALGPADKNYPERLRQIYDPPGIIYYRGRISDISEFALAVVGTRKYSAYGQQAVDRLVRPLAESGLTIVSGLALGIDTLAHQATLESGGRTVAVLGTGLDRASLYPAANRHLAERIARQGGAVISEFPLMTQPLKHNFPLRNRLISGLSLGTLVIEAGEKSGALITARSALDQNREVFAVPGSIFSPVSLGPNRLVKDGAIPVHSADDILEALDLRALSAYIDNQEIIPESQEEKAVLDRLSRTPVHIDELVRLTKMNVSAINSTLALMEMKGLVKNLGNMEYVLSR